MLATDPTSPANIWEEEEKNGYQEELDKLLEIIPEDIQSVLKTHKDLNELVEIVMDLGRPPVARFSKGDQVITENRPISYEDLQVATESLGEFGDDNRAGRTRT